MSTIIRYPQREIEKLIMLSVLYLSGPLETAPLLPVLRRTIYRLRNGDSCINTVIRQSLTDLCLTKDPLIALLGVELSLLGRIYLIGTRIVSIFVGDGGSS